MPKLAYFVIHHASRRLAVLCLIASIAGLGSAVAQEQGGDKKTDSPEAKKPKSTITLSTLKLVDAKKPADPSAAAAPAREVKVLQISGSISRSLLANIKQQPISNALDPIPAGLIVMLDSKGGDGMAGMEIGRILRAAKAHVFVTGECSSACIFALSGGVVRSAPTFSVGIHQARITLSSSSGAIAKEVDSSSSPTAKALLEQYEITAPRYFADMGIPADLFIAMQSFPAKRLHRLSSQEITLYGLNGIEDEYLMQRTQFYEEQPGRWPKDKDEFLRRTMKVSTDCMPFDKSPVDFVKCYRRTLQDIY
jgi:ATP-dependent protease ClpP protease subunit